jgi:tetratricopeptide (TPR) repeat protein
MNQVMLSDGTEISVQNVPSFTIENSSIANMINGINCIGSTGTVANSTISYPRDHGIVVSNGSNIDCYYNQMIKSDLSGAGVYYGGGSYGNFYHNDISGFYWGLGSIWGSSPLSYNPYYDYVNNHITGCGVGLRIYTYSGVSLSSSYAYEGDPYAYNGIHDNDADLSMNDYSFADAYTNHWTSDGRFQWDNTSTFSYLPSLERCPICNSQNIIASGGSETAHSKTSSTMPVVSNVKIEEPKGNLDKGRKLKQQKQYRDAIDCFVQMIENDEQPVPALLELYSMESVGLRGDIITAVQHLPGKAPAIAKPLLATLYQKNGDLASAKRINSEIVSAAKSQEEVRHAKLQLFNIALYQEHDVASATQILGEVTRDKNALNDIEVSLAQHALQTAGWIGKVKGSSLAKQAAASTEKVSTKPTLPEKYELFQNYPNPFNPSTTISYDLPEASQVTIKIYDYIGREVMALLDGYKSAGRYQSTIDASNLGSGVYFYKLQAGSFTAVKKMLLVK